MFTPIGNILTKSLKRSGLAPTIARTRALDLCAAVVRRIFKEELAGSLRPLSFRHGILTVACTSMAAAGALREREAELLAQLRREGMPIERLRRILAPWR